MNISKVNEKDFEQIFSVLVEAFPESELRTKEKQHNLLNNPLYKAYSIVDNNRLIGTLLAWEYSDFRFIEHFAILPEYRDGGIGTKILKKFILLDNLPVYLEVEPPSNVVTKKRIAFYKHLGFKFNDYLYYQPAQQKGQTPVKLKIMSYPDALSEEEFISFTIKVNQTAYRAENLL